MDTNLFDGYQNINTFKRIAKIESIQIPKISSILFNQSAECQVKSKTSPSRFQPTYFQKFEELVLKYCQIALPDKGGPNLQNRLDHWSNEVFHSKLFLYFQTSEKYRMARWRNSELDDGHNPLHLGTVHRPWTRPTVSVESFFFVRGQWVGSTANRILAKYNKRRDSNWWFAFEYFNKRLQIVLLSLSKWKS